MTWGLRQGGLIVSEDSGCPYEAVCFALRLMHDLEGQEGDLYIHRPSAGYARLSGVKSHDEGAACVGNKP